MDEAGIPMLVSRYIKITGEAQNEGLVVDNHCAYYEGPEGTQIWNILLS